MKATIAERGRSKGVGIGGQANRTARVDRDVWGEGGWRGGEWSAGT